MTTTTSPYPERLETVAQAIRLALHEDYSHLSERDMARDIAVRVLGTHMSKSIPRPTRKHAGDYGGPGVVVAEFEDEGKKRLVVRFKIADGFGCFYHILSPSQLTE